MTATSPGLSDDEEIFFFSFSLSLVTRGGFCGFSRRIFGDGLGVRAGPAAGLAPEEEEGVDSADSKDSSIAGGRIEGGMSFFKDFNSFFGGRVTKAENLATSTAGCCAGLASVSFSFNPLKILKKMTKLKNWQRKIGKKFSFTISDRRIRQWSALAMRRQFRRIWT